MSLRKISLVITLLLSVCFVYAQGTEIDVIIQNSSPSGYQIDITLHQISEQPTSGSLSYNISANSTNTMHLEFDGTDICIDKIKCTYPGSCTECAESASLNVNCTIYNNSYEEIAPYNCANRKCYNFHYYSLTNPDYDYYLYYNFKIHL